MRFALLASMTLLLLTGCTGSPSETITRCSEKSTTHIQSGKSFEETITYTFKEVRKE